MIQPFLHRHAKTFDHHRCLALVLGLLLMGMPDLAMFAKAWRVQRSAKAC
jgi:hypothetical protein